jgi:hypothetical protein
MSNIKTLVKEILRWGVIIASGGYGVWQLFDAGRRIILRWNGDLFDVLFLLLFPTIIAVPFLAVAYICLRRQYRKLFLVLGVIGSLVIFFELFFLPEQLGIFQFMDRHTDENHSFAILGLPIILLSFFGPIYAAAWFFRFCHRLANPGMEKEPRTRATRWLIWSGVLCLVVSPMIALLVTFHHLAQSSDAFVSPESINNLFRWIIGLSVIGTLLMFLGLVHRQPFSASDKKTSLSETI